MKYILSIALLATCFMVQAAGMHQSKIKTISIQHDTVYSGGEPYCLLEQNGKSHIIRNFFLERIVEITSEQIDGKQYYKLEFPIMYKTYYTQTNNKNFVTDFLFEAVKFKIIEDGYYSDFGTRALINTWESKGKFTNEWKMHDKLEGNKPLNWVISYKNTDNTDSTIILADGEPFVYYHYKKWKDVTSDKYLVNHKVRIYHSYYMHNFDGEQIAEVRICNGWRTTAEIRPADGSIYTFSYTTKDHNILTIASKLLLARNIIEQKKPRE